MRTYGARRTGIPAIQYLSSVPLLVSVIVAVLVGALAGLIGDSLGVGIEVAVVIGVVATLAALATLALVFTAENGAPLDPDKTYKTFVRLV